MKKLLLVAAILVVILALGLFYLFNQNSEHNRIKYVGTPEDVFGYISCGCGCCASDEPLENIAREECIYRSKGESLESMKEKDNNLSAEFCATAGCSYPTRYIYCD